MDPQKSMREDPTPEIGTDLSLDKAGNRCALPSCPSQEGLELLADDVMKKGLFGLVAFVFDGGRHSIPGAGRLCPILGLVDISVLTGGAESTADMERPLSTPPTHVVEAE